MTFERGRRQMIADIEAGITATRKLIGRDHLDQRVMTAMRQVHRKSLAPLA